MAMVWTPAFAVGIPEIDQQHQELFYRLSKLLEGIVGGDRAEVARLIDFLGQYVVTHFGAEERWMVESEYPDYEAHKAEHDRFMQDYLRYSVELEQKGPTALVGMRVNNWIADWLRSHIMVSDMALGRFLSQKLA
jgi:hemerythrin